MLEKEVLKAEACMHECKKKATIMIFFFLRKATIMVRVTKDVEGSLAPTTLAVGNWNGLLSLYGFRIHIKLNSRKS